MPDPRDIYCPPWTRTFCAEGVTTWQQLADVNAIKTSIATSASVQLYTLTDLNGVIGQGDIGAAGVEGWGQLFTVKNSSSSGSYKFGADNPIVAVGLGLDGLSLTQNLLLTTANGGETILSALPFTKIISIGLVGQNDTSGAWEFGLRDVVGKKSFRRIRAGAAGNVKVGYQNGFTDLIPLEKGESCDGLFARVYGDASTTALPVTVLA